MVEFDAVRVLKTLKFGEIVYQGGKIYTKPLPPDILKEVARGSPYIEVIRSSNISDEPQKVQEETVSSGNMEQSKNVSKFVRRGK